VSREHARRFQGPRGPGRVFRASGALQGALLVQRTIGDSSQLKDVISAMKAHLRR